MKFPILKIVLLILLVLIIAVVVFVIANAVRNAKQMNAAADRSVAMMRDAYDLTPVDCSEFEGLKIYGIMGFDIEQYQAEGYGNLCVMRANAGLMQMLTLCFMPAQVDMPLLSVDYMYILGNRTAYVEVYDLPLEQNDLHAETISKLQAVAKDFTGLTDTIPTPGWYDDIRPAGSYKKESHKADAQLLEMLEAYLNVYIDAAKTMPALTQEQISAKVEIVEGYSHRLISEGGISTNAFKESLGEERTTQFFDQVMFGTGLY